MCVQKEFGNEINLNIILRKSKYIKIVVYCFVKIFEIGVYKLMLKFKKLQN